MSNNQAILSPIYINFITTESNKIINLYSINILVVDPNTSNITYQETSIIKYYINNYNTIPQYFFSTYFSDTSLLTTNDFIINLPREYNIYYDSIGGPTLYIYTNTIYIPIVFLGSINSLNNITVYINANLLNCFSTINSGTPNYYNTCIFSGFSFDKKTFGIPGSSTYMQNYIADNTYLNSITNINNYYGNYNNLQGVNIDNLLKIYNYDYSYYKIKNIKIPTSNLNNLLPSINVESIIFMIKIFNSSESIFYNYIVNLNYDLIDYDDSYNIVIFFKNFINNEYSKNIKLYVFEYDYYKYFDNLTPSDYDLISPITIDYATLYDLLIKSNDNLLPPSIPIINNYNQNFNKIMIINNLFLNQNLDVISEFLKSSSSTIDLLTDYLSNFNIKPYNFWKITTNYSSKIDLDSNNFLLNSMLMNVNIIYKTDINLLYYNLYAELFNNNNKIDLYHKNYILTKENKKQLIKNFIIIILNYLKINIYFYNNIEDLNNKLSIFKDTINDNIFIKFNKFILPKSNTNLRFNFDQFYNLNITIDLSISYKIIIFKVDINNTFNETILNFKYNNYIFQIFNIPKINGNIDIKNKIYYIVFSDIKECNEFINYIKTGILDVSNNNIKSFFNISKSLNFKKNENTGYYEISTDKKNIINFSIINLDLSNSSIFTNNTINIL